MSEAILIYASTEAGSAQSSADLLWRTKFRAPDPIMYIEISGQGTLLASSLEYSRAKMESNAEVILIDDLFKKGEPRNMIAALTDLLRTRGVTHLAVPATLPYSLGKKLSDVFELRVVPDNMFPERARKNDDEVREIERAGDAVGHAIEAARAVLRDARIDGDTIQYQNEPLTSETLRTIIEKDLFNAGYLGVRSIVSCGIDAAHPHAIGSGPLRPHQPIVCDIFPRSMGTDYHADITRTLFKGAPSEEMRNMYEAVRNAQRIGIDGVKVGVDVEDLQKQVEASFAAAGYETKVLDGIAEGFIHSLGHGVGLEVHEMPHVGGISYILEERNVITIEPGLYHPVQKARIPTGGIRIEDMVVVEATKGRVLAELPTDLAWAIIP